MTKPMIVLWTSRNNLRLRVIEECDGMHGEKCFRVCKENANFTTGHGIFRVRQGDVVIAR